MARPVRPAPRVFSDNWPVDQCADQVAEVARLIALSLKAVTNERGTRSVARDTGVSHSVISRIVNGETWADTATLARLEAGLDTDLWPARSRPIAKRSS